MKEAVVVYAPKRETMADNGRVMTMQSANELVCFFEFDGKDD
jgi:hypothetical protein